MSGEAVITLDEIVKLLLEFDVAVVAILGELTALYRRLHRAARPRLGVHGEEHGAHEEKAHG